VRFERNGSVISPFIVPMTHSNASVGVYPNGALPYTQENLLHKFIMLQSNALYS
jgi:hypothetical protein